MPAAKKTIQKKKPASTIQASRSKAKRKRVNKKPQIAAAETPSPKSVLEPTAQRKSSRSTSPGDADRSIALPGYLSFTSEVWRILWKYKSTFLLLVLVHALLSGLLVGLASQGTYSQLGELLRSTGDEASEGGSSQAEEVGLLLLVGLSGGIGADLSEVQQMMIGLLALLVWLVTVWMLRAFLAGRRPSLRDGFYNAGAPIIPTVLLGLFFILQLVPAAIAMIGISAALPTGLISGGVEAIFFWTVMLLLVVLSLYWVTSTLIALVVVTLPGMYPAQALKTARKLVAGRRLKILLRIVWLFFITLLVLGALMIPIIIFDAWLKGVWGALEWMPIIPLAWLLVGAAALVWIASYIYLLYRKVVANDTASA